MIRKGQREWVGQEKENKFFLLKKKKKNYSVIQGWRNTVAKYQLGWEKLKWVLLVGGR